VTSSALRTDPDLWVPPRYATPRDPARKTMGGNVARVAQALGQPLMPWQQYVADVAGEVDARGRYVYPLVVVSVPRQSGKTTLGLSQAVQRCLQGPNRRSWWTAQTGKDAGEKWREQVAAIQASPLRQLIEGKPRMAAGNPILTFTNGSTLRPHPPQRDALHGQQSDHNDIDEGWSFDVPHGDDLFQAIVPTQATRPGAQTFVWSTRGDADSVWFHNLVDRGLSGAPGVALFDWGIPAGADPTDLAVVAAHHPAVGHTIDASALSAAQVALGDKPGEFARAYGNRATGAGERLFPLEQWNAAVTTADLPDGRPAYAVAVAEDASYGSLLAAVADEDGRPWLELIERRPGRAWLVPRVLALTDRGAGVAVNRRGPAGPTADALELAGVTVLEPLTRYPAACQDFHDRITSPDPVTGPRVRIRSAEALDAAADVAGKRPVEDGGWTLSRTRSTGDVDALEAAVLGAWAVARAPEPVTIGRVYFR
jgi:hypothetical protein